MYLTSCHLSLLKCPIHYLKQKSETDKTSWQKEKEAQAYTQMLQTRATEAQGQGKSFLDPNWIKQF